MTLSIMKCWPDLQGSNVLEISYLRRRGRTRNTESVVGYFWQSDGLDYKGFLEVGLSLVLCPAGNQDVMTAFLKTEKYGDSFGDAIVRDHHTLARFNHIYDSQTYPPA